MLAASSPCSKGYSNSVILVQREIFFMNHGAVHVNFVVSHAVQLKRLLKSLIPLFLRVAALLRLRGLLVP